LHPEKFLQLGLDGALKQYKEFETKIKDFTGDAKLAVTDPKAFLLKKICDVCTKTVSQYTNCAGAVPTISSACASICSVAAGCPPCAATCLGLCTAKG